MQRITHSTKRSEVACPNPDCASKNEDSKRSIKKNGKTSSGNQRYRCLDCGKSFCEKPKRRAYERSEVNSFLFKHLVEKSSITSISRLFNLSPKTVYDKIDFIYKQCIDFSADRESRIPSLKIDRVYLCTDRQVHTANWSYRKDKRNCDIYEIATACQRSGYVFGFSFNYAPDVNIDEVEKDSELLKDPLKPKHHRKYARIWLPSEFASREPVPVGAFEKVTGKGLVEDVSLKLNIDNALNKSGASEFYDSTTNVPSRGALVHNEYTMLAHFYFLKNLFTNVGKTRFYMDVDSGMKMSYLSAFREEVAKGVSDGFMLKGAKEFTVDEKEKRRMASLRSIARYAGTSLKALTDDELK